MTHTPSPPPRRGFGAVGGEHIRTHIRIRGGSVRPIAVLIGGVRATVDLHALADVHPGLRALGVLHRQHPVR